MILSDEHKIADGSMRQVMVCNVIPEGNVRIVALDEGEQEHARPWLSKMEGRG
jgi:hypothetical protein